MKEAFEKIKERLEAKCNEHSTICVDYSEGLHDGYEGALNIVSEVEAEYGNGWIPCSERLPEIGQRVLLWVYGQVHIGERMGHKLFEKYDVFDLKNGTFESTKRIEAWMPLPLPYQPQK